MSKIIIGLVGPIASGKGAISDYLKQKYNAGYHRFSNIMRDLIKRLGLPESRENLQQISICLRRDFGEDLFARAIKAEVENDEHEIVVVDGIRRQSDITFLRELPNFILIYIDADIQTRYQRTVKREENASDAEKTFEQFMAESNAATETSIPELKSLATEEIDNNGTLEELYEKIEIIIQKHHAS